ncbi:hypothetical protein M513_09172 [Trichuris suis]|uniref:Uncharacterized protein n=1 Tax=Trichuris suis TaxID=68888 RepID=A0A085LYB2_9BILA|nr:hypothetical protein M513_11207 [Trichuris suis]KFD49958.1 hypothetical protein M513_09172 [Trichuris suis]
MPQFQDSSRNGVFCIFCQQLLWNRALFRTLIYLIKVNMAKAQKKTTKQTLRAMPNVLSVRSSASRDSWFEEIS